MKLIYHIGKLSEDEQLKLDFEDGLSRTVEERIELGFIPMKLPMIDDAPYLKEGIAKTYPWIEEQVRRKKIGQSLTEVYCHNTTVSIS